MNIEWKILMNNFKIPKIRFMNFNDKWKYKILGEISSSIEYGLNASAKDFDGIHKYLRITDIDDSSRLFLTDKLSSPDVDFTEEDYDNYKLQINDLLFARTGASVGKTYLYRESDGEVYYAGFLIRARLCDSYDGNFVFQQTLTDKYKQFIEITSQRSGQPGINGKEYGNWKIGMTSYSEQSAIGSFFRTLDDLLTSYKNNLANYQSLKATMLSKMFPKAGQTIPEIRLDGFEGEWKEKTLGSLGSVAMNKRIFKNETSENGGIPFYKIGTFGGTADAFISKEKFKEYKEKYPYPEIGDILISASGSIGRTVVYNGEDAYYQDSNIVWLKHDQQLDNSYLKQYYGIIKWSGIEGTTIKRLYNKNILETKIFLPPSVIEQQAIGTYFSNLDNLINSYQEKISQLETLKKKLLQDMFI